MNYMRFMALAFVCALSGGLVAGKKNKTAQPVKKTAPVAAPAQKEPRISISAEDALPALTELIAEIKARPAGNKMTEQEYKDIQVYISTARMGVCASEAEKALGLVQSEWNNLVDGNKSDWLAVLNALAHTDPIKK